MNKSIKRAVWIRASATLIAALLFCVGINMSIFGIKGGNKASTEATALVETAQMAEVAHYKWLSGLSDALYADKEFTGSKDPTACALGKWIYGEAGTEDPQILTLRDELEPLHKEIHNSASHVLDLLPTDPGEARSYYHDIVQSNVLKLIGILDQIVERSSQLQRESGAQMQKTILFMQLVSYICFLLAFGCLVSLIYYVSRHVLRPILKITKSSQVMLEGRLDLDLGYQSENELGQLAATLEQSMGTIGSYVAEVDRIMAELSRGRFDTRSDRQFIGDFAPIQQAIDSFTTTISAALARIDKTASQVSGNAEYISNSSQQLAQGATEQASAVEELFATLDELSKNAAKNAQTAADAQRMARQSGDQALASNKQMEEMERAMADIQNSSQEIGKIIATIENIAFQTNILALNAAVEAARAGSAGKGFAVVADEVRNLAFKSDEAAKATKELIEHSIQTVHNGSQIVTEVSRGLKLTLDLAGQSAQQIGHISEAVNGEATTIAQVTEGIGQISAVVQTNSATSEESAAVSSDLFSQAKVLQEQTNSFRLKSQA